MAGNFNLVVQMGNLTADPQLRYTRNGSAVASFGIATNHKWKDSSGKLHDDVCFTDWECWGPVAESLSAHCSKGSCVMAQGRLRLDRWEVGNSSRSKLKAVAELVQFITPAAARGPAPRGDRDVGEPEDDQITQQEIDAVPFPDGDDTPF